MNEDKLRKLMMHNCVQVFATMMDTSIVEVPGLAEDRQDTSERMVSLIGFGGGDHSGNCMITCSKSLACKVASIMLMEEYTDVNADVMDAFGEISNMVFGNVKTDLEEDLGSLKLSIPSVIMGQNFNIRNVSNPKWVTIRFIAFEKEELEVRMCLASRATSSSHSRLETSHGVRNSA